VTAPKWTIATARQNLTKLIGMAAREPQRVYRRDKLVAAVVSPELADQVETVRRSRLAAKLAEPPQLCADEDYALMVPVRRDRPDPFAARRGTRRARRR